MPIYAFQCADCGHPFDRLQKMSDPDPQACPSCGANAVKRQVTAPTFRLAGSGWYETDFKKDGDKKRNLSGGTDSASKASAGSTPAATDAGSSPKAESKAETKPATPTPAPSTPAA